MNQYVNSFRGHSPGVKFPRVLGIEAVGLVEESPGGEFAKGDVVATAMGGMGRQFDGGYAEFTCVPTNQVQVIKHPELGWEKLGALPEMMNTAWGALFKSLRLQPDDHLLIRGGTSSVGLATAAIAKNYCAYVAVTTRKSEREGMLKANGANDVFIDNGNIVEEVKARHPEKFSKILELVGVTTPRGFNEMLWRAGDCLLSRYHRRKMDHRELLPKRSHSIFGLLNYILKRRLHEDAT